MIWGSCTESQCKEYLLHPEKRDELADQYGAVRQKMSGPAALKHLTDRSFLCLHFHMDRAHTLTPCTSRSDSAAAQHQSDCQSKPDGIRLPETPRQTSGSGRAPSGHYDACR